MLLQETVDRLRRRRTDTAPIREALVIDDERARILGRIVGADVFEETATAGAPLIGHDEAIKGPLFGTGAGKTNVNGHL